MLGTNYCKGYWGSVVGLLSNTLLFEGWYKDVSISLGGFEGVLAG
jgi:hypothetical protein